MLMRDAERRKKEANKQQGKATQHTQGSHFSKCKMSCLTCTVQCTKKTPNPSPFRAPHCMSVLYIHVCRSHCMSVLYIHVCRSVHVQCKSTNLCCGSAPLSLRVVGAEEKLRTENTSLKPGTLYNCVCESVSVCVWGGGVMCEIMQLSVCVHARSIADLHGAILPAQHTPVSVHYLPPPTPPSPPLLATFLRLHFQHIW